MGEILKRLGTVKIKNADYEVELNMPHSSSQLAQIHIQASEIRLEATEIDFCRIVCSILKARAKLEFLKSDHINAK